MGTVNKRYKNIEIKSTFFFSFSGANINAQTEETQETALTLACCGGFLEVADYLIKHGADIELGASTPLMEAAQEGHLDLVKFLLENKADVHAQTQTGDTALTYACENGHTDVAEVLLYFGAELEHLSEGGRTPLMKACRAGHICTVKFLIQKGADVNRQTTNNDHTPLSLACAGGHQQVVELLLAHGADPFHKLKDNSTMLIEAAKGGHTGVVQLLLDYPTCIPPQQNQPIYIPAPMPHQPPQLNMAQMKHQQQQQLKMLQQQQQQQHMMAQQAQQQFMVAPPGLHDVTEVIRLPEPPGMFQPQDLQNQNFIIDPNAAQSPTESSILTQMKLLQSAGFKDGLAYGLTKAQSAVNQMVSQQATNNMNVAPCSGSQHQPMITNNLCMASSSNKQKNVSRKKCASFNESQSVGSIEVRGAGVGGEEEENVTYIKSTLDKVNFNP
jgi:ankyrin repeat protein